ncbi:hypothetical protein [Fulvitalea axinellae]
MKKISDFLKAGILIPALFLLLGGCGPSTPDSPLPLRPFDTQVNLFSPKYSELHTKKWVYVSGIGLKGVIIRKISEFEYRVFERNCTYLPNDDSCNKVNVDPSGLFMYDPCGECGSRFEWTGRPTQGQASQYLFRYSTELLNNGKVLRIFYN